MLYAALALVAIWQADDRAASYGLALLALGGFLVAPRVAAPWFGGFGRLLLGGAERRRPTAENRTAQVLSDFVGVVQMLLWFLLVVFVGCVITVTVGVWDASHAWLLRIAFAAGIALYVGLLLLWMTYATRAAAGDRADRLSGDVTLVIRRANCHVNSRNLRCFLADLLDRRQI
jgi:hypothetical protein